MEAISVSLKPMPYVYRLTHKTSGRYYIGYRSKNVFHNRVSSDDLGRFYFSSSREIGRDNFSEFEVVVLAEFFTGDDAHRFEQILLERHWDDPLLINRFRFKYPNLVSRKGFNHTEAAKKKIAEKNTGKVRSLETRRRISEVKRGCRGHSPSRENVKKMNEARLKYGLTDADRKKMSNSQRERFMRPDERQRIKQIGAKGTAVRMESRFKVAVTNAAGESKVYDGITPLCEELTVKARNMYHLATKYHGIPVPRGRFKGLIFRLIKG